MNQATLFDPGVGMCVVLSTADKPNRTGSGKLFPDAVGYILLAVPASPLVSPCSRDADNLVRHDREVQRRRDKLVVFRLALRRVVPPRRPVPAR